LQQQGPIITASVSSSPAAVAAAATLLAKQFPLPAAADKLMQNQTIHHLTPQYDIQYSIFILLLCDLCKQESLSNAR